eukprot:2465951-Pyramimonas_sp.AAC.1
MQGMPSNPQQQAAAAQGRFNAGNNMPGGLQQVMSFLLTTRTEAQNGIPSENVYDGVYVWSWRRSSFEKPAFQELTRDSTSHFLIVYPIYLYWSDCEELFPESRRSFRESALTYAPEHHRALRWFTSLLSYYGSTSLHFASYLFSNPSHQLLSETSV